MIWIWLVPSCLVAAGPFASVWSPTNYFMNYDVVAYTNVIVDWGDGFMTTVFANATALQRISHTYDTKNPYTISMTGQVRWGPPASTLMPARLLDIVSWGDGFIINSNSAYTFSGYTNMRVSAPANTQPVMLAGATLKGMFSGCTAFNSSLDWNLANVTSLEEMFANTISLNQPVSFSNTQGVTSTRSMFEGATSFNQPLTLNTDSVTTMDRMFFNAISFNQPLNFSNTSQVTSTSYMFYNATSFNQPISSQANSIMSMSSMFEEASNFNSSVALNTTLATTMDRMFCNARAFNQPIMLDTRQVTTMKNMFANCSNFNQPLTSFRTDSVETMEGMFWGATKFNQSVAHFNVSKVTNMTAMFQAATNFNQPIDFDTPNLADTTNMFRDATSFDQPVTLNTSNVVKMTHMFRTARSFASTVNFTSTARVTDMGWMFDSTSSSFKQNLAGWNASNVVDCYFFCPFCVLPSFPRCTPCGASNPIIVDNASVCSTARPTTSAPSKTPSTSAPTAPTVSSAPTAPIVSSAPSSSSVAPSAPSAAPSSVVSVASTESIHFAVLTSLLCALGRTTLF